MPVLLEVVAKDRRGADLMGARLKRPLENGERVRVQYSVTAQNVDAYFGDEVNPRAEVRIVEDAR